MTAPTEFVPPQVALLLALARQAERPRPMVTWCLVRVHAFTNAPIVVQTCEAETRDDALALFPPHPAHWFVTSRIALDTLGTVPVGLRCACGRPVAGERPRGGRVVCDACAHRAKLHAKQRRSA